MVYGDGYDPRKSTFGGEARDNFLALKIEEETNRAVAEETRLQAQIDEGVANDAARYLGISQNLDTGIVSIEILNKRNIRLDKKDITITNKLITEASLNSSTRKLNLTCIDGSLISCDLTDIFTLIENNRVGLQDLSSDLNTEVTRARGAETSLGEDITTLNTNLSAETTAREAVGNELTSHKNNKENPHEVTKDQVGLGNVDNTSDANKPLSTAAQTALNAKADKSTTYTKDEMDAALGQKQPTLNSGINIKTINGDSLLGSGNIAVETYQPFFEEWPTSNDYTVEAFCAAIDAETSATVGMAYLGGASWSNLPFIGNGDVVVEIMQGPNNSKAIHLILTSGDVAPYRWEYTYWNHGSASGWKGFQPTLVSGTNIKTVHGQSILGPGDIDVVGPQGPQGIQGETGPQGPQGNGIIGIRKTSTSGLEDTYTITYLNGTTSTFVVTNGADGSDGPEGPRGPKGDDGLTTTISVNGHNYEQSQGVITLPDYPNIPTSLSSFTNDMGYITNSAIGDMATQSWVEQKGYITGIDSTDVVNALGYTPGTSNFTGDYNTLTNKPIIPAAQIQADWDQTDNTKLDFIKNKPTIPTALIEDVKVNGTSVVSDGVANVSIPNIPTALSELTNDVGYITGISWGAITGKPTFATVAQSGSYLDLTDKPTLFSGSYNDLTDKPTLFSGDYNDLTNKPTIPDEVIANPTLTETEPLLEGLQIGNAVYRTARAINIVAQGTSTAIPYSVVSNYKAIVMTGYKHGVSQPNATTIVFTPANLGDTWDSASVFRCIAVKDASQPSTPASWEYTLRVRKDGTNVVWQTDTDYGSDWDWYATVILGVN